MTASMWAQLRRLTAPALLWVALAALQHFPTTREPLETALVAGLGFACFAVGIGLLTDAPRLAARR